MGRAAAAKMGFNAAGAGVDVAVDDDAGRFVAAMHRIDAAQSGMDVAVEGDRQAVSESGEQVEGVALDDMDAEIRRVRDGQGAAADLEGLGGVAGGGGRAGADKSVGGGGVDRAFARAGGKGGGGEGCGGARQRQRDGDAEPRGVGEDAAGGFAQTAAAEVVFASANC